MIDEITIENLALIKHAQFCPAEGLTVLTGETGSGKTALLSASKLLMGERADRQIVSEGAQALKVAGRFLGIENAPSEADDSGDDEVVVVRRLTAEGRTRVTINGEMGSLKELSHLIKPTIDLCGQHEHQQLLDIANHRRLLDTWGGTSAAEAKERYQEAFTRVQERERALQALVDAENLSEAHLSEARFKLKTIESVDPQDGEYETLKADLDRAESAEAIVSGIREAQDLLRDDDGILDQLGKLFRGLSSLGALDSELVSYVDPVRDALFALEDVGAELRAYADGLDFDPESLQQKQERIASLQGLLRTYGPTMDEVFRQMQEAQALIDASDNKDELIAQAQRDLEVAETALLEAAEAYREIRTTLAPDFEAAVNRQLGRLEMASARIACNIEPLDRSAWSLQGPDKVEFLFSAAEGRALRPLKRIASGGEISRVMLALKVALGAHDEVQTLIFDEIDAGVGGATAKALGEVLADLAKTHQVIVVTHLAQIAVMAQRQYVVKKIEQDRDTFTELEPVEGKARIQEIARMLSGEQTEEALAHAEALLESASGQ